MTLHDLYLVVIAFLSEIIGTLSGFGSSTFFVPLAIYIESFSFVLVLTSILHCFGNASKIFIFREFFSKKMLLVLGFPSILFAGIGALLSSLIDTFFLTKFLGLTLIIVSILKIFRRTKSLNTSMTTASGICMLSGLLTGMVGTGGALRGMALTTLGIEKNTFVILSAGIDLGGDILRTGIYIFQGHMDWSQWFYVPMLGIAAFFGASIGKKILKKINQEQFEKIVTIFILISGIAMLL